MNKKILLIVEGEKTEVDILGNSKKGLLSIIESDYEIVTFKNPIYELYDAYIHGEYDDLVSYLRCEKGLQIDDDILSKEAFSAIYLVFDFEAHYHKYSDKKIKDLLRVFNDETENGKLYINYPMVEAYYHLERKPDDKYNDRMVNLTNLTGKKYKTLVHTTTCFKTNNFTKKDICFIIMQNYNKAQLICDFKEKEINHMKILNEQLKLKNKCNKIYVLSTFPFLLLDYNFDYVMNIVKETLQNNFLDTKQLMPV